MKILQHAPKKTNIERIYIISCSCGCKFEFSSNDPLIEGRLDKWDNIHRYIKCPDCENIIHLSPSFF